VRRALGQTMTEEVLRNIIIQRGAKGLTVEDLAELTGIEIAPPPQDEKDDEEEEGDEVDEDEKGDEVEENDADEADDGCSAE